MSLASSGSKASTNNNTQQKQQQENAASGDILLSTIAQSPTRDPLLCRNVASTMMTTGGGTTSSTMKTAVNRTAMTTTTKPTSTTAPTMRLPLVGDRCVVLFPKGNDFWGDREGAGGWFEATIESIGTDERRLNSTTSMMTVSALFEDGTLEENLSIDEIRLLHNEGGVQYYWDKKHEKGDDPTKVMFSTPAPTSVQVGDLVLGHFQNGLQKYRGRVAAVHTNTASCDIIYDDGDYEKNVSLTSVVLLQRGVDHAAWLVGLTVTCLPCKRHKHLTIATVVRADRFVYLEYRDDNHGNDAYHVVNDKRAYRDVVTVLMQNVRHEVKNNYCYWPVVSADNTSSSKSKKSTTTKRKPASTTKNRVASAVKRFKSPKNAMGDDNSDAMDDGNVPGEDNDSDVMVVDNPVPTKSKKADSKAARKKKGGGAAAVARQEEDNSEVDTSSLSPIQKKVAVKSKISRQTKPAKLRPGTLKEWDDDSDFYEEADDDDSYEETLKTKPSSRNATTTMSRTSKYPRRAAVRQTRATTTTAKKVNKRNNDDDDDVLAVVESVSKLELDPELPQPKRPLKAMDNTQANAYGQHFNTSDSVLAKDLLTFLVDMHGTNCCYHV
jgi:hypothetical protein